MGAAPGPTCKPRCSPGVAERHAVASLTAVECAQGGAGPTGGHLVLHRGAHLPHHHHHRPLVPATFPSPHGAPGHSPGRPRLWRGAPSFAGARCCHARGRPWWNGGGKIAWACPARLLSAGRGAAANIGCLCVHVTSLSVGATPGMAGLRHPGAPSALLPAAGSPVPSSCA